MDDILVFAGNEAEHDTRLINVLKRIERAGVTLSPLKCDFKQSKVRFLGHIIDGDRIKVDPEKTAAIRRMVTPQSVSDLRRFLGMENQLGKFFPNIS